MAGKRQVRPRRQSPARMSNAISMSYSIIELKSPALEIFA